VSQAAPREIEKRGDDEVRIVWDDGHASVYRNTDLRFECPCASCIDEWTGVRRLRREDVPEDVRPTGLSLVGNYAAHIDWSDGHSTGIYTWDRLRDLCTCAACANAARGSRS
jgi:DUF971 family protein